MFAGHDVEAFTHPLLDDDGRDRGDTHELAFPLVLRGIALLFQASEEVVADFLCVFLEQTADIAVVLTVDTDKVDLLLSLGVSLEDKRWDGHGKESGTRVGPVSRYWLVGLTRDR